VSVVEYGRVSEARSDLKKVLDAASAGTPVTVRRDTERFAVVDADRLRHFLSFIAPKAEIVNEGGGWVLLFPGLPLAAEGATLPELCEDAITVLREYAADWVDHLRQAPNHRSNWGLVQLVALSSDEQLMEWITGSRD
jgi:hypothetical protein